MSNKSKTNINAAKASSKNSKEFVEILVDCPECGAPARVGKYIRQCNKCYLYLGKDGKGVPEEEVYSADGEAESAYEPPTRAVKVEDEEEKTRKAE
jgi:uncharacterized C2H2 Zn-finger protein